jgi:hypothetical protein
MKWILIIIVAILAAIIFMPVTVTGSVYVITKGKETVDMPMTEVRIYDKEQFLKAWDNQSVQRLSASCNQGPTELEKMNLDLRRLREGLQGVPNWKEMDDIYTACGFDTLIWNNPEFKAQSVITTDKNGEFSFNKSRFKSVIIFSKGSRKVFKNDENYIWLHKVSAKTFAVSQKIELNNSLLVNELRTIDYPFN